MKWCSTVNSKRPAIAWLGVMLCLCLLGVTARSASAQCQWSKISDALFQSVPDYDHSIKGGRGVGGVAVDRHTDDVIVGLCGAPFGMWRSSDAGKTWNKFGPVSGGWVRNFSIRIDQDKPGRVAVFRVYPPGPDGKSMLAGMTLDDGQNWTEIEVPRRPFGLQGAVHGMVDWSKDVPTDMICQPRCRPDISFSQDGGKKWTALKNKWIMELTPRNVWMQKHGRDWPKVVQKLVHGYGLADGAVLLGRHGDMEEGTGIDRSTDAGETYEHVSDFIVSAHTPVAFGGNLYWGAEKGVIVSEDAGKTWTLLGKELPMVRQGPFFGKDASAMVVVTEDGVYKTTDAAETWTKLCDLYKDQDAWKVDAVERKYNPLWLRHSYAWDYTRDILYCAGMAGSLYQMEVK